MALAAEVADTDATILLVPENDEETALTGPQQTCQRTRVSSGAGLFAMGLMVVAVMQMHVPRGLPPAFHTGEQVELTLLEPSIPKPAVSMTSEPGPWQCAKYEGEQDNNWCKAAGNVSGYQYEFFGPDGPCDDCWCCKRAIEERPVCAGRDKGCLNEHCCQTPGFQCYEKTPFWATCRQWCVPGPDPTDSNGDFWTCKELGLRAEGNPPPPDYSLKASPWVATLCSGRGENCSATKCCKEEGVQCFTKAPGWASCKPECTPGPDPTDSDSSPWECQALGSRTPGAPPGWGPAAPWVAAQCSGRGEDCSNTQCCKEPGHQCYKKKDGWAMCMPSCLHGPLLTDANPDIWDCAPLGGRTPGLARASLEVQVAPWVATHCSQDGADCRQTMCCSNPTSQCYMKDDKWATCMRGCAPGVHDWDTDKKPWTCNGLGPRTPRPWAHPSLYCFSVAQIYSAEGDTIRTQINTDGGAGIFACEQFDIFSTDGGVFLGDGPAGPVWSQHFDFAPVGVTIDGTAGNTRLFMNVWEAVKLVGRYKNTDWTVKADPDAVLMPDRLRDHVASHTGHPNFIITCTLPGMTPMMFGALEAISREAIEKYFQGKYNCNNLPADAWGEDRWLGACLAQLGAPGEEDYGLVSDGVCHGVDCNSGAAAFHPFKNAGAWQGCYYQAKR